MKKKIIILTIVILGLFCLWFFLLRKKPPVYEFATVKKGDLKQTVSASGKIVTGKEATLQFQTSGKLAWIGVKEGDKVNQWQAVAGLDTQELEKKLKKELNDYTNERWDFQGDRETYNITTDDLDKYTLTNAVRRLLDKNQFDLNNVVLDVEIANFAVELATLVSPIQGIVTKVEAPVAGVNTTPSTSRITVSAPEEVYFEALVDENDIAQVVRAQKTEVSLDAYQDEKFTGIVREIAFTSVKTSGGGNAFPVKIYFDQPNTEEKFKIGMNGDAEITITEKNGVFYLSPEAVKGSDKQKYVQILEKNQIKKINVQTGLENESQIEIVSGITEGQKIIVSEKKKK